MPGLKEYDIKIADYFDDKMTAAEEESFMDELGTNTPLRERYEDELAIRAILGSGAAHEDLAGVDNVVYMHAASKPAPNKAPVMPLYRRYKNLAAVIVLIMGISAAIIALKNQRNSANTAAITPVNRDSVKTIDTLQNTIQPRPRQGITAAGAFAQFYKPYTSNNDPVETSIYYQDYNQGRYEDVFAASDADLQVMGVNDNKKQLSQYLQLYKGLAYLAENKPAKALLQLEAVMQASPHASAQYYTAQWYGCMAVLQQGDVNKAGLLAKAIAHNASSPYKTKAGELVAALGIQ